MPIIGSVYVYITGTLENCTCNYSDGEKMTSDSKDIVITANEGYTFNGTQYQVKYGDKYYNLTISHDKTTLTGYISSIAGAIVNKSFTLDGEYIAESSVSKPVVRITGTFENCSCNYENGEEINVEKNIEIVANEGFEFTGTYTYIDSAHQTQPIPIVEGGKKLLIDLSLQDDLSYDIVLNDDYIASAIPQTLSGFVNLYKVDDDILADLSKVRFKVNGTEVVDYGQFILSLYVLNIDINSIVQSNKSIILGNYDTNIVAPQIVDYKLPINFGTINVTSKYNNAYDYINTECILRLPFLDSTVLDNDYVINQTLTISGLLDIYSGTLTINVFSTFTNGLIYSDSANIVTQIPFIQSQNNSVVNTLSNINTNLIESPCIEVTRNIPYYVDNIFGKETVDYCLLSEVSGYCEVNRIELETSATNEEKSMIVDLLNDGVYIK